MVYYLGTDSPAPLVPAWDEKAPAFHVVALDSDRTPEQVAAVRQKLARRHVVYIGSSQGCGCGFRQFDEVQFEVLTEEKQVAERDHRALFDYLDALPPSESPLQIFGCWSGDEVQPVEYRRECSFAELVEPRFGFREREIISFRK